MTMANLNGPSFVTNPQIRAGKITPNKPEGGKKTADDVLAYLREMMPGWTITTSSSEWGEGFRNIEIDREILQRMADDPREMEKYKAIVLGFEDAVPALERWGQENPGQAIEIGISIDAQGNISALATIKTLMGIEKSTSFELPSDKTSWAEIIRTRLEALNQSPIEDAFGSKSWLA